MFLPKNVANVLHLPSEYISYLLGIGIYGLIYWMQRIKVNSKGAIA
jgi:hypothetical protein